MESEELVKSLLAALLLLAISTTGFAADAPPDWAYPVAPRDFQAPPDDGQPKHVAGSRYAFTGKQVEDGTNPADWFPDEHPPMPNLVAHGKAPAVRACDQCHLATGAGHPESANLMGLSPGYIEEQLREFRNGDRSSSVPRRSLNMVTFARALSDDEVKAAAAYFASLKPVKWTTVKEVDSVPATYVGEGNMRFASPGSRTEPIGRRIIEIPQDEEGAKLRSSHAGFIAYVPSGSVAAGQTLATTGGNGKTLQCSICHGANYDGIGDVPRIAGRGAIYIFRQLYDIQHGTRKGNAVALMQPVVARLTQDDMIALAAFMASRAP